jgi:hypothetical protein
MLRYVVAFVVCVALGASASAQDTEVTFDPSTGAFLPPGHAVVSYEFWVDGAPTGMSSSDPTVTSFDLANYISWAGGGQGQMWQIEAIFDPPYDPGGGAFSQYTAASGSYDGMGTHTVYVGTLGPSTGGPFGWGGGTGGGGGGGGGGGPALPSLGFSLTDWIPVAISAAGSHVLLIVGGALAFLLIFGGFGTAAVAIGGPPSKAQQRFERYQARRQMIANWEQMHGSWRSRR